MSAKYLGVNGKPASVVHSALWAAAGDAIGWITELLRSPAEVVDRVGSSRVLKPSSWTKRMGAWPGVEVNIPSGGYSDDTQLRLATSRAIRGDGRFDPEVFGKIELPVWLSYALGAGLGSKAAAESLIRRNTNWFSNFYSLKGQSYMSGGGNGAAMRVQPHVWAAKDVASRSVLVDVLRNAVITHGHPHGFGGAYIHARALSDTFKLGDVPGPERWKAYAAALVEIEELVHEDPQLQAFWLSAWENERKISLADALTQTSAEALKDVETFARYASDTRPDAYRQALLETGCFEKQFRGSGIKTALAACFLAWKYRAKSPDEALIVAANEIGSDTDTIATMAGAMLGVFADAPVWDLQDRAYLRDDAERLASIAAGRKVDTFEYPDVATWRPPSRRSAMLGLSGENYALYGLGTLHPFGDATYSGSETWQWMRLSFGQSVLVKVSGVPPLVADEQLPGIRSSKGRASDADVEIQSALERRSARKSEQRSLRFNAGGAAPGEEDAPSVVSDFIDVATDRVIRSGFDPSVVGEAFNELIDRSASVESAIAFAAIVAKARIARRKRGATR